MSRQKTGGSSYGVPLPDAPKLKFLISCCTLYTVQKMSTSDHVTFQNTLIFYCFSTEQNREVGTWYGYHLSHNTK